MSLEAYFSVCCLPDMANRWRWYLRRLPDIVVALDGASEGAVVALVPMAERDQAAFVMLAAG